MRRALLAKYPRLASPPELTAHLADRFGSPAPTSHDAVDLRLLEAMRAGLADILVTDDTALRRRAKAIGLGESALTSSETLELMRRLV